MSREAVKTLTDLRDRLEIMCLNYVGCLKCGMTAPTTSELNKHKCKKLLK